MFAAFDWESRNSVSLNQNFAIEEATELAEQDRHAIRAFVGYAGWTEGQLEQEIAANAWLSQEADQRILFDTPDDQRWQEAAMLLGIDINRLSGEFGHA